MPYCTLDNIRNLLPEETIIQLTDDENLSPAAIDPTDEDHAAIIGRIDEAIAAADATIDAYCQSRYPVPLSPVPPKINQLAVDIAIYNLYSRRDMGMPEIRAERNKEAIRFLEKVADDKIKLGVSTPAPVGADTCMSSEASTRVFTRDKMKGF
ncbi:MAG: DUF1320 domain-containing protein [Syntrophales bacterium]|jgi:phage gp36-like protein|nr:DUF1320 domain-containing protein [Syntrophales bacterium]MCK9390266.1 DUF1320 domain-containing protein [Syntrophales bacterium]